MSVVLNGTNGINNAQWTTAGRPSSPTAGQQGYNTTLNQWEVWNGTSWIQVVAGTSTNSIRTRAFTTGTTYTVSSDVKSFYVLVYGATGGLNGANKGGVGGAGYSEKYYATPGASYSYAIGAAGTTSGTSGGTTTFDVISVTGSAGVTGTTGGAGGAGSGGDYNATGGTGGNYSGTSGGGGGGGGAASRAGNGGNGGNGSGASAGGGGGTGGNNASGVTTGTAATAKNASALVLPGVLSEVYFGGVGNNGACPTSIFDEQSLTTALNSFTFANQSGLVGGTWSTSTQAYSLQYLAGGYGGSSGAFAGLQGYIFIIEVLK